MTKEKLDYVKTVERLDAQIDLLHEQLGALNIALDAKYKEYHLAKKKVFMLDPEIAKERGE
tara:strand:+ start:671 stop:853 length:183 start_codon:yes stop_codon:yes gene_type:complete